MKSKIITLFAFLIFAGIFMLNINLVGADDPCPFCVDTCQEAVASGLLTGSISGNTATVTNNAWKSFRVGLASYRMYDNELFHQNIYHWDWDLADYGETLTLEVNLPQYFSDDPTCQYEIYLFCGEHIWAFYGQDTYDDRLLDSKIGGQSEGFCQSNCGNGGIPEPGEECDDGVNNGIVCVPEKGGSCTYCTDTCEEKTIYDDPEPFCGDGEVNQGWEQCDDGNLINGDGCSSTCQIEEDGPYCGDGNIDEGEECDDGEMNGEEGYCNLDCTEPKEPCKKSSRTSNTELPTYCEPLWTCGGWSECNDEVQTRNCVDTNYCEFSYNQPFETIGCEEVQVLENEQKTNPILWFLIAVLIVLILILLILWRL